MSNDDPSEKKQGVTSEIQAISMDEFGGTIPGVTQLLNPGLERKQNVTTAKGNKKINLKFGNTSTGIQRPENLDAISPKKSSETPTKPAPPASASEAPVPDAHLSGLGVRTVLVFASHGGAHRFEAASPQSPEPLSPWQKEFYRGMVLDPGILSLNQDFCEFPAKKYKFQGDAFGLEESEWLVLMKNHSVWYCVISKKSLEGKRSTLESACFEKPEKPEASGEIKIEIA
jgi:hypothetical protein